MTELHFQTGQVKEAEALVLAHHYSGRVPAINVLVGTWHEEGGLFGWSGPCVAACFIGLPNTRWREEVVELTRLVRAPHVDRPLTGLISQTLDTLRRRNRFDLVVSYADRQQQHHGGIYQAASWHYHELRKPNADGFIIGGRFYTNRSTSVTFGHMSKKKFQIQGIEAVQHVDSGKHLYWKALTKSGKHKAKRLGLQSNPYPKTSP